MGCNDSKAIEKFEKDEAAKAKKAEEDLQKRKSEIRKEHKALLLGAGDSGKSTTFKHMKILMDKPYTSDERVKFKENIFENVLRNIKTLVEAVQTFKYSLSKPEHKELTNKILDMPDYSLGSHWKSELAPQIKNLWQDEVIQKAYARRVELQLANNAKYFFEHLDRIGAENFVPTEEDLLRARIKTTGITEAQFNIDNGVIKLVDVGGQRNERKKWIHCFENINLVIWCISCSEFDEKCYEDFATNRLVESLQLFEETVNNKWFFSTPVLLFMNKMDLLKEKVENGKFNSHFQDFEGEATVATASAYLANKYKQLMKNTDKRQVKVVELVATDTASMRQVMQDTKQFIASLPTQIE